MKASIRFALFSSLLLAACAHKQATFTEDFKTLDQTRWHLADHTYYCNESQFAPKNVELKDGRLTLAVTNEPLGDRRFSGSEVRLKDADGKDRQFMYGRYEVRAKAGKVKGAISSFFLFRWDPWQEIDVEFVGADHRTVVLNVFNNPGTPGTPNNEIKSDADFHHVDFDTSADFHDYAFEWDENEIRWYIDGNLVRRRTAPNDTPNLPMSLHMNHWVICEDASDWAGKVDPSTMPGPASYERVRIFERDRK